jgi:hypothetical protein
VNKKSLQGSVPSVASIVNVGADNSSVALKPMPDDIAAPTGGSATPDEDTSQAAKSSKQANEAAKGMPAPIAGPATQATETAAKAYTSLSATPINATAPFSSPALPAAAMGVAGVVGVTVRRWFRR